MTEAPDAFAHHPELRSRITDPETSFYRTFSVDVALALHPQPDVFRAWAYPDEQREQIRAETLVGHEGDLWVFGYGSLMWDPGFRFAEVRRASVTGLARRLILKETRGARGTEEAPGLVAALDRDNTEHCCEGLAFRIRAEEVTAETEILWRREVIAPGYAPTFIRVDLENGPVQALTFLADHSVPYVLPNIDPVEQVRYIATGAGFLGTSRDYLANIVDHFAHLGIADDHCRDLLRKVDDFIAGQ